MTFEDLYRDVYSRLAIDNLDLDIYYDDIIKALNDAIREQRVQFVRQGMGGWLTETEEPSLSEDSDYSWLKSGTLSKYPIRTVVDPQNIHMAEAYPTTNEIQDQQQSFSKGDEAFKDDSLYVCTEDFSNTNTFNLTFDPKNIKLFSAGNDVKYYEDDIIKYDGSYYRVLQEYKATDSSDDPSTMTSTFEKQYWRRIGGSRLEAQVHGFFAVNELRHLKEKDGVVGVAIQDNKIFVTKPAERLVVSYIPEWEEIDQLDTTINLPGFITVNAKRQAIQQMAQKLNIDVELRGPQPLMPNREQDE